MTIVNNTNRWWLRWQEILQETSLEIQVEIVLKEQLQETVLEIMLEILLEIQDVNSMKKETVCSLLFILNILDNSHLALNYFLY